jgi:hypothetical protein
MCWSQATCNQDTLMNSHFWQSRGFPLIYASPKLVINISNLYPKWCVGFNGTRYVRRWALRNSTPSIMRKKKWFWRTIVQYWTNMKNFIENFSRQLPSFQVKLMSSCTNNLVLTCRLVFVFTNLLILFLYGILPDWKKKKLFQV